MNLHIGLVVFDLGLPCQVQVDELIFLAMVSTPAMEACGDPDAVIPCVSDQSSTPRPGVSRDVSILSSNLSLICMSCLSYIGGRSRILSWCVVDGMATTRLGNLFISPL